MTNRKYPRHLNPKIAARFLQLTREEVLQLVAEGSLPAWKRNGGICIDRATVIALGERLGTLDNEPLAWLPQRL
ncbi:MAG: hypothetical protein ACTHYB_09245 [Canibacter sp.]